MITTIFFDVDGTLLPFTRDAVPSGTRLALQKLKENGIRRVLATGRHLVELEELPVRDLDFDAYITINGHIFLDENRRYLSGIPFAAEDQARIISIFQGKNIPMALIEADRMYLNFVNERVQYAHQNISTRIPDVADYRGAPLFHAIAYINREEEADLQRQIPACFITRWFESAVDIIPAGGGKAAGIRKYLEEQGVAREETMAFGDAENDIDMLRFAGIGVAMGNADDRVKACADYVTAAVDDDGIKKALEHFDLI